MPTFEVIERMLSMARSRFDRSLRCLSDYQEAVARRLRQACQPMLPTGDVAISNIKPNRPRLRRDRMASQRQMEANRRNARKSTGPRSAAEKKTISLNAWRHGLRSDFSRLASSEQAEALALRFAGQSSDPMALEHARAAAQAQLELGRVRKARLALIDRVCQRGAVAASRSVAASRLEGRPPLTIDKWLESGLAGPPTEPGSSNNPPERAPTSEPARTSEAMRRILPELAKLARYERRAASARDRAIRELSGALGDASDFAALV